VTEWGVMGFGVAGTSAGKISIRGMGGGANTHVLILRNGRPDFMGIMGCTIADEFTLDGVERIEILRGPASFLYGTNATGGVINIVPEKMIKNGFKTTLDIGYGAYQTGKLRAIHKGKIGQTEYILTAAKRQTDGHREDGNSKYKAAHFTAHVSHTYSGKTTLECNANLADIVVHDPGTEIDPFTGHWYDLKRYGGDVTLEHKSRWGDSYVKLHGNFGHHQFYDGWRSDDRILGFMLYQNMKFWSGNKTTLGFDFKKYGGSAENVNSETNFGEYTVTEYAPYIHTQQLFGRFIASAGFRLEHHSLYGYETLPKLGFVCHLHQSTSLRISAAKGFRSPSIRELYFFASQNSNLQPDRLWNYEIGLTQFVGSLFKVEGVLFRSEGSNLIRPSNPGFPFQWVNSGTFVHTGYELMASWFPTKQLEFSGSWSKLDLGNETLYAPGKKLTAHAVWQIATILLSGDIIFIQDLYGADNKENPLPDYAMANITVQIPLFQSLTFKAAIKNVFNTRYEAMFGYPMPGRHVFLDLRYLL